MTDTNILSLDLSVLKQDTSVPVASLELIQVVASCVGHSPVQSSLGEE